MSHLCRAALGEGLRRGSRFANSKDRLAGGVRGPAMNGNGSGAGRNGRGQCEVTNMHPCGEAKKAVERREPLELETGAAECSEPDSFTRSTVPPNGYPSECKS